MAKAWLVADVSQAGALTRIFAVPVGRPEGAQL